MFAMNLVDVADDNTNYGILLCDNDNITVNIIQSRIMEIKGELSRSNEDWVVEDIINKLPCEWHVELQYPQKRVIV